MREPPDPKVVARLAKVVRLAASEGNEHEKQRALEAALEIIERHQLAEAADPEPPPRRRPPRPPPPTRRSANPFDRSVAADDFLRRNAAADQFDARRRAPPAPRWCRAIALQDARCDECGRAIRAGNPVWTKRGHKIIHGDWPNSCEILDVHYRGA